jgi:bifunctional non-homologous end joining protein LigD
MLATLVDAPFHRPGWIWEEKYDGIRLIAVKDGRRVQLITRNDKDRAADFPEVAAAIAALPAPTLTLDGEVCVFDAGGISRFQLLQRRAEGASPPIYAAFDCLHARGRDLLRDPLTSRRAVLEQEVAAGPRLAIARRLADDGLRAFEEARRRGLEGVIGKDPMSRYEPGVRSPAWCKVKVRAEEEFVIGGFTAPRGSRHHLGALLVGAWDGQGLRYAGKVGTGFTEQTLVALHRRLSALARPTSPFLDAPRERDVTWLEPRTVAQLAFTEMTHDSKLRHPVFLGLREDKDARAVRLRRPTIAAERKPHQASKVAASERGLRPRNPSSGLGEAGRSAPKGARRPSEGAVEAPSEVKRRTAGGSARRPGGATRRAAAPRARRTPPRRRAPRP